MIKKIFTVIIMIIFSPIFLCVFLSEFFSSSKCKHRKICPLYSDQSVTCMKNAGRYSEDKFAGCYIDMMQKKHGLNK